MYYILHMNPDNWICVWVCFDHFDIYFTDMCHIVDFTSSSEHPPCDVQQTPAAGRGTKAVAAYYYWEQSTAKICWHMQI